MRTKYQTIVLGIALRLTGILVFLILFNRAMTIGFSHDEYQFVSSAQLFVQNGLLPYRDYPFLHMPYQVFINAIGVVLTPYHFLAVRALSAIANFFSAVIIWLVVLKKWGGNNAFSNYFPILLASFLFLFNPALISMDGR